MIQLPEILQSRKNMIIASSVIIVLAAALIATSLLYSLNDQSTKALTDPESFHRNDLSRLTYSIEGSSITLKAGISGTYRLEELTAIGDISRDGIRDFVALIKDVSATDSPMYYLTAALSTDQGLVTVPGFKIGSGIVPHSLLVQDDKSITFEFFPTKMASDPRKNLASDTYVLLPSGTLSKK